MSDNKAREELCKTNLSPDGNTGTRQPGQGPSVTEVEPETREGQHRDAVTMATSFSAQSCEKGKQPQYAVEMFQSMQRQDMVPNIITYGAVISACEKGKQPE